ncbi:MAG TPA: TlpA disulfide reductase family protein [Methylophilaceae bacterium]|nr:TlpA disulfide reductase family protein [Methylophilaceae bacterium]HQR60988.1 TlpA disulfide reductase family protein [Methylophilaceae bacterium]
MTVASPNLRKWVAPLLLLILLGAMFFSFSEKKQAPEVVFTSLDGQQVSMAQLRGKVVLVNFWATTCPGCIAEMPKLVQTYQRYHGKGFELVAVAMSYDPPANVASYAKNHALPFTVALDTQGDVAVAFDNVKLTPTAFLIDRQGRVVRNVVGELDFGKLHQFLDKELGRAG